jgi:hypothetical protein
VLRPSAANKNKKGARGKPWKMPLKEHKKGEGDPLIKIEKEGVSMQAIIQFIVGRFIPNWIKTRQIKV